MIERKSEVARPRKRKSLKVMMAPRRINIHEMPRRKLTIFSKIVSFIVF